MKINLNKPVKDLDSKDIENTNVGKLVAQALANSTQGDSLKLMSWATKLYNGEELDLDPSDSILFKDFITSNQGFSNLLKSRVLEEILK